MNEYIRRGTSYNLDESGFVKIVFAGETVKKDLQALKKEENETFMEDVNTWFLDGASSIPFDISDPDHEFLMGLREEVQEAGGKVSDIKSLPKLAQKAWDDVLSKMHNEDLWEKIGDSHKFYELAAKRFFK